MSRLVRARELAVMYLRHKGKMKRTAGEVRFIKDHTGDPEDTIQWAWSQHPPSDRNIVSTDYQYDAKQMKPLAKCMRSVNAALGHAMSAFTVFAKLKSAKISPDGRLGGRGYIQAIPDMRKQFNNIVEALSSISDTLYDELQGPHWAQMQRAIDPQAQEEVEEIIEHSEEIRQDPEGWAEEEIAEDQEQKV